MSVQSNWFERVKKAVNDNIPVIVTIGAMATAAAAVVIAKEAMDEVTEANKESLRNIEDRIQTAIEAPTVVRVEIGDDIEFVGMGNRTD